LNSPRFDIFVGLGLAGLFAGFGPEASGVLWIQAADGIGSKVFLITMM
jgi:hypothetical protein